MNSKKLALVMAGGQGTRFWPESTSKKPKQYLKLIGNESLLSQSLSRLEGLVDKENRFLITVQEQKKLAEEHSKKYMASEGILFEPSGQNTAPCIFLSILELLKKGHSEDDVMAVLPSDQVILNSNAFHQTLSYAFEMAFEKQKIVTIGIVPEFAHTGYGYIQRGESLANELFDVKSFKEKPESAIAKEYFESGEYYWNAGMFMAPIGVFLKEFERYAPEIFKRKDELLASLGDEKKTREVYSLLPNISIDFALIEHSKEVIVVPAKFDWTDLGSWDALENVLEKHEDNILIGNKEDYYGEQAQGNIVYAPGMQVSLCGVDDLIIVANGKNLLVLPKKQSQNVKKIVSHFKKQEKWDLV